MCFSLANGWLVEAYGSPYVQEEASTKSMWILRAQTTLPGRTHPHSVTCNNVCSLFKKNEQTSKQVSEWVTIWGPSKCKHSVASLAWREIQAYGMDRLTPCWKVLLGRPALTPQIVCCGEYICVWSRVTVFLLQQVTCVSSYIFLPFYDYKTCSLHITPCAK